MKVLRLLMPFLFQFLLLGCLWTFFDKAEASGLIGQEFSDNEFSGSEEKLM